MKKIIFASLIAVSFLFAKMQGMPAMQSGQKMDNFRAVPLKEAQILQKGPAKLFCPKCGMSLPMFYKSNHAAKIDGKVMQFCSMHCLVEAMQSAKKISDIKVVDNTTLKFIPVSKAWYVVGSSKPATMSKISKYAFGTKEAALKFAKKFGGKVMRFKEALEIAKENLKKEQKMIKKKQAMMAKMGKVIYDKKCQKTDKKFATTAQAKAYIKSHNLCKNVKGKELQAVGLYLKNNN